MVSERCIEKHDRENCEIPKDEDEYYVGALKMGLSYIKTI